METNNKEFRSMKLMFCLQLIIFISLAWCYYLSYHRFIGGLFLLLLIVMIVSFINHYTMISNIYSQIRKVIQYIDNKQTGLIIDGDIGLLYDKVFTLEKRNKAYEEVIKKEKENLKNTIEDICHQMKTPLSSISINNELLLETIDDEKIMINQQQIDKLKDLISSLLTLAKLENDVVHFEFQKLPLKYLLDLSIQSIYSLIQEKEIIIDVQDKEFFYDESWLVEAISNILKNALEQEAVTKIKINSQVIENYLKVYIHDNGQGIDSKDLPHLFERFYKSKNSHKESVGIGLSLTKEIIRLHHGFIDVYNDQGACFELTFPLYAISEKT